VRVPARPGRARRPRRLGGVASRPRAWRRPRAHPAADEAALQGGAARTDANSGARGAGGCARQRRHGGCGGGGHLAQCRRGDALAAGQAGSRAPSCRGRVCGRRAASSGAPSGFAGWGERRRRGSGEARASRRPPPQGSSPCGGAAALGASSRAPPEPSRASFRLPSCSRRSLGADCGFVPSRNFGLRSRSSVSVVMSMIRFSTVSNRCVRDRRRSTSTSGWEPARDRVRHRQTCHPRTTCIAVPSRRRAPKSRVQCEG
jgi:hypothetical protein